MGTGAVTAAHFGMLQAQAPKSTACCQSLGPHPLLINPVAAMGWAVEPLRDIQGTRHKRKRVQPRAKVSKSQDKNTFSLGSVTVATSHPFTLEHLPRFKSNIHCNKNYGFCQQCSFRVLPAPSQHKTNEQQKHDGGNNVT